MLYKLDIVFLTDLKGAARPTQRCVWAKAKAADYVCSEAHVAAKASVQSPKMLPWISLGVSHVLKLES